MKRINGIEGYPPINTVDNELKAKVEALSATQAQHTKELKELSAEVSEVSAIAKAHTVVNYKGLTTEDLANSTPVAFKET